MEAISNILHQVILYPFSTGIHLILMGIAGGLIVESHYHDGVMARTFGIVLAALWTTYEVAEFAQIQDNVAADLSVGIVAYIVGAAAIYIYHWIKRVRYARRKPKAERSDERTDTSGL